jgi:hypothetical protein
MVLRANHAAVSGAAHARVDGQADPCAYEVRHRKGPHQLRAPTLVNSDCNGPQIREHHPRHQGLEGDCPSDESDGISLERFVGQLTQEVEIAALVGLKDVVQKELSIPAPILPFWPLKPRSAL